MTVSGAFYVSLSAIFHGFAKRDGISPVWRCSAGGYVAADTSVIQHLRLHSPGSINASAMSPPACQQVKQHGFLCPGPFQGPGTQHVGASRPPLHPVPRLLPHPGHADGRRHLATLHHVPRLPTHPGHAAGRLQRATTGPCAPYLVVFHIALLHVHRVLVGFLCA